MVQNTPTWGVALADKGGRGAFAPMLVLSAACWYARARQKPPMPFVLDRAGVRPIDYDPAEDAAARQPRFDPSLYSPEQLVQIEQTLRMIAATQAEAENAR
jgi:hypothetical protein